MDRERLLVAVSGGPGSEHLVRRGEALATRNGAELHVVQVAVRGRPAAAPDRLARLRELADQLGGALHMVDADDPAVAVLEVARGLGANQVMVGVSGERRWPWEPRGDVGDRIVAAAGTLDIVVVARNQPRERSARTGSASLGRRRLLTGWFLALAGPFLLSTILVPARSDLTLALESMSYLVLAVTCALVGGRWPAIVAAVLSSLALNWFSTPPERTLVVADPVHLAALLMFLVVASAVASVVDTAARRSVQADLARREADTLMALNRSLLHSDQDVTTVLSLLKETFTLDAVALLRRSGTGWEPVSVVGEGAPTRPGTADTTAEVASGLVLAIQGGRLEPHETRCLAAFATHISVVLKREELARRVEATQALEQGNRVRTALLAAVSHDLRTPLASIKAAVSSLRSPEVTWSPTDRAELLAAIEDSTDHLHTIVANLLDLSRLQTDAVHPLMDTIWLDDVVSRTVATLPGGGRVRFRFAADLPPVVADAGLLDRVVSNLVDNALKHSPADRPVTVVTDSSEAGVQLRVVDHGPGVPAADRERMYDAFRRLGDTSNREGLGLGLAVARGLTEAQGGVLRAEDTTGGGLTMLVELPAASIVGRPHVMADR